MLARVLINNITNYFQDCDCQSDHGLELGSGSDQEHVCPPQPQSNESQSESGRSPVDYFENFQSNLKPIEGKPKKQNFLKLCL